MAKQTVKVEAEVQASEHVPQWKRYKARAVSRGFANNRLYEAGDEFTLTVDVALKPPSWVEYLDEGESIEANNSLQNAVDFAKDETPRVKQGFAAGIAQA